MVLVRPETLWRSAVLAVSTDVASFTAVPTEPDGFYAATNRMRPVVVRSPKLDIGTF